MRGEGPSLRLVVCDLSHAPHVDFAGARMLDRLHEDLASRGMEFHAVEAPGSVRNLLRAQGLERDIGHISRKVSLAEISDQHAAPLLPLPA